MSEKAEIKFNKNGFSLVEVLLAGALLALIVTAFTGTYIYGRESVMLSGNRNRAVSIAEEGLEVARSIRDSDFNSLNPGTFGIDDSGNEWSFSGNNDAVDIYERQVEIVDIDENTKEITSRVIWQQNAQRTGEVFLTSYLTNWKETVAEDSCNAFAVSEGYLSGICRLNSGKCEDNSEEYLADGDSYCGGPPDDTCCALPDDGGGTDPIQSCDDLAVSQGYSTGTCRANSGQCSKGGETYLPDGDVYCTGGAKSDTCCGG